MVTSAERMRALRERERRGLSSLPAGFDYADIAVLDWVPSGTRLEFGGAISGNMRLSFQAARSIG